jgi:hypothetical protein
MFGNGNIPGQPEVQKPVVPWVVPPPPANSIYEKKWSFKLPQSLDEPLTAPGMPKALLEVLSTEHFCLPCQLLPLAREVQVQGFGRRVRDVFRGLFAMSRLFPITFRAHAHGNLIIRRKSHRVAGADIWQH